MRPEVGHPTDWDRSAIKGIPLEGRFWKSPPMCPTSSLRHQYIPPHLISYFASLIALYGVSASCALPCCATHAREKRFKAIKTPFLHNFTFLFQLDPCASSWASASSADCSLIPFSFFFFGTKTLKCKFLFPLEADDTRKSYLCVFSADSARRPWSSQISEPLCLLCLYVGFRWLPVIIFKLYCNRSLYTVICYVNMAKR